MLIFRFIYFNFDGKTTDSIDSYIGENDEESQWGEKL
jgi:hypothetical protein